MHDELESLVIIVVVILAAFGLFQRLRRSKGEKSCGGCCAEKNKKSETPQSFPK
ncbi:FeoB-associated Cys-rich membrane protein [bacterium]|nr:FeoB-associated Cys-rich membrane protein [bacterium]